VTHVAAQDLPGGIAVVTDVSLTGVRALVVEDEMMVSMLLEDMPSDIGCTPVGRAAKMDRALKSIENAGFDVAILDVDLNGTETYPIADALAARGIPFVFASGYTVGRLREEYRSIPSRGAERHAERR
jgi:CheY-like chemotaxis protein